MCCSILGANNEVLQVTVIRIAIETNIKGICVVYYNQMLFLRKISQVSFSANMFSYLKCLHYEVCLAHAGEVVQGGKK